jgi:hypothetical protein
MYDRDLDKLIDSVCSLRTRSEVQSLEDSSDDKKLAALLAEINVSKHPDGPRIREWISKFHTFNPTNGKFIAGTFRYYKSLTIVLPQVEAFAMKFDRVVPLSYFTAQQFLNVLYANVDPLEMAKYIKHDYLVPLGSHVDSKCYVYFDSPKVLLPLQGKYSGLKVLYNTADLPIKSSPNQPEKINADENRNKSVASPDRDPVKPTKNEVTAKVWYDFPQEFIGTGKKGMHEFIEYGAPQS